MHGLGTLDRVRVEPASLPLAKLGSRPILGQETSRRAKAGPAIRRAGTRWLVHAAEAKRVFRTDRHDDRRVDEAAGLAVVDAQGSSGDMQESCFGLARVCRCGGSRVLSGCRMCARSAGGGPVEGILPDGSGGTRVLRLVGAGVCSQRGLDLGCAA